MRKTILSTTFFLLLAGASFAHSPVLSDPHDSLLFDGEENLQLSSDDDCALEVVASGSVEAMVRVKVLAMGCGEGPDSVWSWERKQVKTGDYIKAGEEIVTGPDGYIKIPLADGSVIVVGNNSQFTPAVNICDLMKDNMSKIIGKVWTSIKKALGGAKYECTGPKYWAIGVRGTEFSVEADEEIGVVRVYEGTVDMKLLNPDWSNMDESSAEIEQLAKDLREGKITVEEFQRKVMEKQNQIEKQTSEIQPVTVEPGYKCIATKNSLKLEPIESNDDRWWEELDFK